MKHLSEDSREILGTAIAMLSLAVVSVALRFFVRFATRKMLPLSDGLILVSLICLAACASMMIHYIVAGPGPGTFDLNIFPENTAIGEKVWARALLQMLYAAKLFGLTSLTFIKLSLLAFFHTLFSVSDTFRWCNWITAIICITWFVLLLFLNIFVCRPIHIMWDTIGSTDHCMSRGRLWLGMELTNLLLDVIILCLPLSMLKALPLTVSQKFHVACIFLLGGLACITSMVKLAYIWVPSDHHLVRNTETCLWSLIQLGVATLCACLPTYAPLFRLAQRKVRSRSSDDKVYGDCPQSPYNRMPNTLPDGTYADNERYRTDSSGRVYMEQSADANVTQLRMALVRDSRSSMPGHPVSRW